MHTQFFENSNVSMQRFETPRLMGFACDFLGAGIKLFDDGAGVKFVHVCVSEQSPRA